MADRRLTLDGQIARMAADDGKPCVCGCVHAVANVRITLSRGALSRLPAQLNALGAQAPYLLMDENTRRAAGGRAMALLKEAGIPFRATCLPAEPRPQADMAALPPLLRQTEDCDFVLGVGSGVINDLCKMLGLQAGLRTGIVATAPSMDGYASNSSAMIVDGVKTTVYNQTPALVLGDLVVLRNAPAELIGAGVGDMAAKAISIAEWQIAHEITGEYYCPMIAQRMLAACGQAVEGARQSMRGGTQAVRRLTEGLIVSGIAMSAAQVSRPASGSEHTLSHLMDMLAIRRGMPHQLHGMQVGYGVR
ncbi:MAG: iron-containing alcohol dehydrogenase, partial [Bacillota bacterium]